MLSNNSEVVDLAAEGRIEQPLCFYDLTGSSTSLKTDEQRRKMVWLSFRILPLTGVKRILKQKEKTRLPDVSK